MLIKDRRQFAGKDVEVVEVAHEALLREWRELHDALLAEQEFLVAKSQLEQDVAEWRAAPENRKSGALLSGNKLFRAREWLITRPQDLSVEESQFIRASSDQEFSRRRWRRAAVVAAFIAISGFAGYAVKQSWEAEAERGRANSELKKAQMTQSLFLADLAHQQRTASDAGTAVLLALEALPDRAAGTTRAYVPEAEFQLDGAWRDLRERLVLKGHAANVSSAAFSPDGRRIVTASDDHTVRLWDAKTGKPIGEPLRARADLVTSATFSPDGKRIVTGSADNTARLWDAETGRPIGEPLKGHAATVSSAAFSPDGKRIVTGSADNTARLWDAETGRPIGEPLKGHAATVSSAAFSPDGKRIVTSYDNYTVRLWDADTGEPIGGLKGSSENVLQTGNATIRISRGLEPTTAAFSPDAKRIVSGSISPRAFDTAQLWDVETGKFIGEFTNQGTVSSASFSPDGKRIVVGSIWPLPQAISNTAQLRDAVTGKPIGELKGHQAAVLSAAFSPDGKRIVTGSADKTVRLWDAVTGKPIGEPQRPCGYCVERGVQP